MTTIVERPGDWHVSASQFKNYTDCKRKWWFAKIARLPVVQQQHFAFGTVMHGVIERWMLADDTGRGADGQPVELYPPNWHIADADQPDRTFAISNVDQDLIRNLIHNAIANGDLRRIPTRKIESEMYRVLFEVNGERIVVKGYIDLIAVEPPTIEDHKSSKPKKGGGNYFLSKPRLAEDIQMLIYAAEVLFRAQATGGTIPDRVLLRHNQFLKDHELPKTKHTEVWVTVEDIQRNWQKCLMLAQEMYALRNTTNHLFVTPTDSACGKYGGCPYLTICSGQIKPEDYKQRILRMAEVARLPSVDPRALPISTGGSMPSVFDPAPPPGGPQNIPPAAGAGGFGFPTQAPAAPAQFVPQPTAPVANVMEGYPLFASAPWATGNCGVTSCAGSGVNSAGGPCGVCKGNQSTAGGVVPDMFQIGPDGRGHICWRVLPDFASRVAPQAHQGSVRIPPAAAGPGLPAGPQFPGTLPSAPPPVAPPAPPPAPPAPPVAPPSVFSPPPVAPPAPPVAPPVAPPTAPPAAGPTVADDAGGDEANTGPGRPRKSITVFINCFPSKGFAKLIRAEDIFNQYGNELAKARGVESYWHLKPFDRRDEMMKVMPGIVAALKHAQVTGRITGANDDLEAFIKGLAIHASHVVEQTNY